MPEGQGRHLSCLRAAISLTNMQWLRPLHSLLHHVVWRSPRSRVLLQPLDLWGRLRDTGMRTCHCGCLTCCHVLLQPPDLLRRQREIEGVELFVCCHGARDQRCGTRGLALARRLGTLVEQQGLGEHVRVHKCSHIGGHKVGGSEPAGHACMIVPVRHWGAALLQQQGLGQLTRMAKSTR